MLRWCHCICLRMLHVLRNILLNKNKENHINFINLLNRCSYNYIYYCTFVASDLPFPNEWPFCPANRTSKLYLQMLSTFVILVPWKSLFSWISWTPWILINCFFFLWHKQKERQYCLQRSGATNWMERAKFIALPTYKIFPKGPNSVSWRLIQ